MSHPARLSLRAPPHLPFIQGWPGIPEAGPRKAPGVHGTVEVRIGPTPIKAKWVRVEIRKYESLPPGFPSSAAETWEHIGDICTLWSAGQGKDWDMLEQADFKFWLPLPENIPPTVEFAKNTGVRYELVAALCYRQKGGVFKKESAPILKISEPLRILKHELHSAWPLYSVPDTRSVPGANGDVKMTVSRPSSAFGPTDRILLTGSLKSTRAKTFKFKGFECILHETLTTIPTPPNPASIKNKKTKPPAQPVTKSKVICSQKFPVDENMPNGAEKSSRMDMAIPADKLLVTVRNARLFNLTYELEVRAVCDSGIQDIKIGNIKYVVGPFARSHAQQAVRDIGHFEPLSPPQPTPTESRTTSPISSQFHRPAEISPQPTYEISPIPPFPPGSNGFASPSSTQYPRPTSFHVGQHQMQGQQPIQGFTPRNNMRRKSSGTSTTTLTTIQTHDIHSPSMSRPQSMVSRPQSEMMFPTPTPSAGPYGGTYRSSLGRSDGLGPSSPMVPMEDRARYGTSELGHEDRSKRYSTATSATFGNWDAGLSSTMTPSRSANGSPAMASLRGSPSAPSRQSQPPSAWPSSEHEKMRLYNEARDRAATAQQSNGASLDALGFEPPSFAPPDYAASEASHTAPPSPSVAQHARPAASESPQSKLAAQVTSAFNESGEGSSSSTNPPVKPIDEAYLSAEQEKELQRKRYEAATRRIASGSSSNAQESPSNRSSVPVDDPVPYDAIYSGPSVPPQNTAAGSSSSNTAPVAAAFGGLTEKEQMRRYYKARDRVAATGQNGSPASPPQSSFDHNQAGPSGGVAASSSSSPPTGQSRSASGSASLSEKEQMRRYYEAQDRVNKAGMSPQNGDTPERVAPPPVESTPSPSRGLPRPSKSSSGPSGLTSGLSEKEQMRRYYEAQEKVARAANGDVSEGSSSVAVQNASTASSSTAYPSAAEEKEMMKKRFENAQAAVERKRVPEGGLGIQDTPKPPRSSLPADGPPPPLPSKPPKEYINLLSPTHETGPSAAGSFFPSSSGISRSSTQGEGSSSGN